MKRRYFMSVLILLLIMVLAIFLVSACGGDDDDDVDQGSGAINDSSNHEDDDSGVGTEDDNGSKGDSSVNDVTEDSGVTGDNGNENGSEAGDEGDNELDEQSGDEDCSPCNGAFVEAIKEKCASLVDLGCPVCQAPEELLEDSENKTVISKREGFENDYYRVIETQRTADGESQTIKYYNDEDFLCYTISVSTDNKKTYDINGVIFIEEEIGGVKQWTCPDERIWLPPSGCDNSEIDCPDISSNPCTIE